MVSMKTYKQDHQHKMDNFPVRLIRMTITTAMLLLMGNSSLSAVAQNASDNSGGNVFDGNASDISGGGNSSGISGEESDSSSTNGSDDGTAVLSNQLESALEQLTSGCGDGCSTEDLTDILELLKLSQDACASLSTCTDEVRQRLENSANQVEQILEQG